MIDLGTVRPGSTIRIPFSSFDKDDGSSITMTNYAAADILVYKDGSTTERASTAGFTATTDFDTKTGKHLAVIDLADNTTSGFWNAGSEYLVAIDAVTVDAVTTGGWIARFVIGYPNAILNTTIATLSTQTSFTLTAGPAEDNALVGMWAIIHDIASAVQFSKVLITGYTGSTKTVTLSAGATFTAAAGDNFSVIDLAPLQATTTGRTLDVSSTGEAGIDWANVGSPTTSLALTGTTIASTQKVDIETIKTNPVVNAGTVTFPTTATLASTTNITAGTITTATNVTTVNGLAANVITAASIAADAIGASELAADAATEIAAAVWDKARASHVTAGSFGEGVASVQGNVTGNVAGSVGSVTGAVGSVTGAVGSVTGNVGGNVTGSVGSIATGGIAAASFAAGAINAAAIAADAIGASELAADAVAEIADAVWDEARAGHVAAGSFGEGVASVQGNVTGSVGSVTGAVGSVTGAVGSVTGNVGGNVVGSVASVTAGVTVTTNNDKTGYRLSAAGVDDIWDEATSGHTTAGTTGKALTDAGSAGDPWSTALPGAYGAGTAGKIIGDNIDAAISTRLATAGYTAPLDAAGTRSALGLASANLDTQLAAIPTGTENADALLGRNVAGGADGTRTVSQALYVLRNKTAISGGTLTVYGTDDATPSFTAAVGTTAGDPISSIDPA